MYVTQMFFFIYNYFASQKRLDQVLESSADRPSMQRHLDASDVEIVISGTQNTRIQQKQVRIVIFVFNI
jgi:hypothetical protein